MLWSSWWAFSIVVRGSFTTTSTSTVRSFNNSCNFNNEKLQWQWGVSTTVAPSTMNSFNSNYTFDNEEFRQQTSHKVSIPKFLSSCSQANDPHFQIMGRWGCFFWHFKLWFNSMGVIPLVLLVSFYTLQQVLWINHICNCIPFVAIFENKTTTKGSKFFHF